MIGKTTTRARGSGAGGGCRAFLRVLAALLACLFLFAAAAACSSGGEPPAPGSGSEKPGENEGDGPALGPIEGTVSGDAVEKAAMKTIYGLSATDALGRTVSPIASVSSTRKVGIFYFLWSGEHGSTGAGPDEHGHTDGHTLDISKLPEEEIRSGSDIGRHHYWNEPLYGYYRSDDPWVFRKHLELLTLAGVDYLVFDYTNSYDKDGEPDNYYKSVTDKLFPVALEMQAQGWPIPKFIFMLNNDSHKTLKFLYDDYYTVAAYDSLWYRAADGLQGDKNAEGKPWVVCGDVSALDAGIRDAFYIKQTQWPNEAASTDGVWDYKYKDNGFPWMSWERVKDGKRKQYSHNGIMSVSIAQHVSGAFSDAVLQPNQYNAVYGRGWASGDNGGFGANSQDRVAGGSNFQEQWDYAIEEARKGNVNNVFVTGWNEWVAQKQEQGNGRGSSYFVDLYNDEFSRDAEMSKGPLGDNYYMQLVENIRKFKGVPAASAAYKMTKRVLHDAGDLSEWEGVAGFGDFGGDTAARDHASSNASLPKYQDKTGRNDIVNVRAVYDDTSVSFLITCADNITPYEAGDKTWMNLFLSVGSGGEWNGYQYVVNRTPGEGTSPIQRLGADGEGGESVGTAKVRAEGRYMVVVVPRAAVGLDGETFTLSFKVSDHVAGYGDILNYYVQGDAAPIGRFSYTAAG